MAPAPSPSPTPVSRRLAALDAARTLGVIAMVVGHTLDAVLSPVARNAPAMLAYWHVRGFTAPLFLTVAGWASTLAYTSSGAQRRAITWRRVRRAALLLAIGYGLRWPGWGLDRLLSGNREIWAHFLAFDVLHCIAIALLLEALLLTLPVPRFARIGGLVLLAISSIALGTGAARPGSAEAQTAGLPASLPALALAQVLGGTSSFPIAPWAAYFFAGALLGFLQPRDRTRAWPLALGGLALIAAAQVIGLSGRGPGDPMLIAYRLGVTLAVLAILCVLPVPWAGRISGLGRGSLGIYALHLAIVYGWSTIPGLSWRVGPTLGVASALGVAFLVLAASAFIDRGWRALAQVASARLLTLRCAAPERSNELPQDRAADPGQQ